MNAETREKLISRTFGDSLFMSYVTRRLFRQGRKFKALMLALWSYPIRKLLTMENAFITAPREYYEELHGLLKIAGLEGLGLVRVGKDNDGGYIMPDDISNFAERGGGLAYSFGISDDVSWDRDIASRGYDVFMYDHTIDGLPEENPRFHWQKLGLSDSGRDEAKLKTLDTLIKQNHHENQRDIILKIDVEGAEWGFLENVSSETLGKFRQIVIEFHGINDPKNVDRIPRALRKLNATHQLVHLHGQTHGYYVSLGEKIFCNQLEASYVRKDSYGNKI